MTNSFNKVKSFNPTVVRLRHVMACRLAKKLLVSIPLWCDCDVGLISLIAVYVRFQYHCGAIAT
ncbi:MAG: hypothetical protein NZ805_16250, partial [Armatimonadetes bacterium]|nr:hypothetical protein [Armatimonadota bacterium]